MTDKKHKPAFTNMRWSEADDKLLRELIERGADGTSISNTLGRTRSSVFNRKFVLGIEQAMKKTRKGNTNPLTYNTRVLTKNKQAPQPSLFDIPEPIMETPVKAKKETKIKSEVASQKVKGKGKIPYNFKLAQINMRRRRGDIAKVAAITGFSQGYVSTVINGLQDNERIINVTYNMVRGRKTNEVMMKK